MPTRASILRSTLLPLLSLGLAAAASPAGVQSEPPAEPPLAPPVETVPRPAQPTAAPTESNEKPPGAPVAPSAPPAKPLGADPDSHRKEREAELHRRFLPATAASDRLERLPAELALNDEGKTAFAELRRRYDAAWEAIRGQEAQELRILLPAAFRFDHLQGEFEAVHTPELLALLRLRDRLATKVDLTEDSLAKELEALTPFEQRAAYRRWRLERTQELYGHAAKLPAAGVNLVDLLPKAGLSVEELAPLESGLDQYTEKLADAIRSRHRRLVELEREQAEALVSLGPEWRAGRTVEEALEVDRELAQLAVAETLADMPLRDLNQATFNAFRRQLVPAAARKATEAYQRIVHPEVFEDERGFRLVVEDMLALPSIAQDQISAVVETLTVLEDRMRPASQQAVELADGLIAASKLAPSDAAAARILLEQKLQGVLARRRASVREGLRQLVPLLAADQSAFLQRVDDALATLAAQDRAGQFLADALAARSRELATLQSMGEQPATVDAAESQGAAPPTTQPTAPPESGSDGTGLGGSPPNPNPSEKPSDNRDRRSRGTRRDRS